MSFGNEIILRENLRSLLAAELLPAEWDQRLSPDAPIDAVLVSEIASALGVGYENLVLKKIDIQAIHQIKGIGAPILPERYQSAAFSRLRTSLHFFKFIDEKFGPVHSQRLLRRHQIDPRFLSSPDSQANILLLQDLCEDLTNAGASPADFFEIGQFSTQVNRDSSIGRILSKQSSIRNLHDLVFNELIGLYFDQNYHYRVEQLNERVCVVVAYPNEEVVELLKTPLPGSRAVCLSKAGSFSGLPLYLGKGYATVTHSKCIHREDPYCSFEIRFA
jgi:hypothetical protein